MSKTTTRSAPRAVAPVRSRQLGMTLGPLNAVSETVRVGAREISRKCRRGW
ncbi:hypothetical protein SRIMR7_42125 (plasmid) [Streptomyces rimosus subsp. rimosus]|uniref:Uncharacterized protein n=1 Tax=Streptomyces rimosus subsp. rimosus TaxID=132474 RepID=A0ABY3ZEP5_STRRM|nr:hypothetical protein SRIMR7_42125 [Streptomyces rimosus subsp. rimosus]